MGRIATRHKRTGLEFKLIAQAIAPMCFDVTTVRRLRFEYPEDQNPIWTPRQPAFSCAANAVSLMMPSIEPYFVRSVGAVIPSLPEDLRPVAEAYIAQEAQHHRQHHQFNKMLSDRYRPVGWLDRRMRATYAWLERTRSAQFSLAFAAGSETMAYSAARWAADHRQELFDQADEVAATLFLWHLAEEVEHKSVAFDAYWTTFADHGRAWLQYLVAMVIAVVLVIVFVVAGTTTMLACERRLHHPISWIRLSRWSIGFAYELLTNLVLSLFPNHHPSQLVDPAWYEVWLREYDTDSATLPVWNQSAGGRSAPAEGINPSTVRKAADG